jgi:hypothetical protein
MFMLQQVLVKVLMLVQVMVFGMLLMLEMVMLLLLVLVLVRCWCRCYCQLYSSDPDNPRAQESPTCILRDPSPLRLWHIVGIRELKHRMRLRQLQEHRAYN